MTSRAILFASGLVLQLLAGPVSAQDAAEDARAQFDAGVAAFAEERYADALAAFKAAYELRPHPVVLVNIANCHMELGEPVEASALFERYLREADPDDRRRPDVE